MIFAENPDAWGNSIKVQVKKVGWDPEAFEILVYETVKGVDIRRESFICSRSHRKDGHGTQMFIEDRINHRSNYIRVVNNPAVAEDVMPAFWTNPISLTGSADGDPVSDADITWAGSSSRTPLKWI